MNARARIVALVALCVTQFSAAAWSIARYETTLRSGALYKIPTAAIDPADAFRGRYVWVQPAIAVLRPIAPETERLLKAVNSHEATAYVVLANDADGFARAAHIVSDPPGSGDYLQVADVWARWEQPRRPNEPSRMVGYTLSFSFDRYYMNEGAAPAAQQRYIEAARRNGERRAWLTVRVRKGAGVIEALFIDGVAIEDIVGRSGK